MLGVVPLTKRNVTKEVLGASTNVYFWGAIIIDKNREINVPSHPATNQLTCSLPSGGVSRCASARRLGLQVADSPRWVPSRDAHFQVANCAVLCARSSIAPSADWADPRARVLHVLTAPLSAYFRQARLEVWRSKYIRVSWSHHCTEFDTFSFDASISRLSSWIRLPISLMRDCKTSALRDVELRPLRIWSLEEQNKVQPSVQVRCQK